MKQELTRWAKKELEKEKKQLMQALEEMDDVGLGLSLKESMEELSAVDQHPADVASEVFERSKDFALRENSMLQIRAIDQALQNIQDGTYGRCQVCGGEIPPQRLRALPYTTYCVHCRRDEEKSDNRGQVRPVEEEVMEPVLTKGFSHSRTKNMYDAEDTWQDLASWQEHAPDAGAGSYYGGGSADEEHTGYTEMTDHVPYRVGDDGFIYESTRGMDDEMAPAEKLDVGWER